MNPFKKPPNFDVDCNAVKVCDELNWKDIEKLTTGELLAIRVPYFYPQTQCKQVVLALLNHEKLEGYKVAPNIRKIGKAIFDAVNDPAQFREYYKRAPADLKLVRALFAPNLAPMDLLRVTLQEKWPASSLLENLHGQPMFCGLVRLFNEDSEALPHQDVTPWDVPEARAAWSQQTQLAANIYLELPSDGGALELWDVGFETEAEYKKHQLFNSYGLDRAKIPQSKVVIYPKQGELILFDARRIHAVQKINRGVRLTSSCFIGYRGITQPLSIYS